MTLQHQCHYDIIKISPEQNSRERLVVDEMSMTLKEAVATLAIRGDILQARRSAIGGFSIDKETAYGGLERAQTNPQYIDTIKRMQIKRETQIQLQKLAEEAEKRRMTNDTNK